MKRSRFSRFGLTIFLGLLSFAIPASQAQTPTKIIYKMHAAIEILPPSSAIYPIYVELTAKILSKARIDLSDNWTKALMNFQDKSAIQYPLLQYIDGSGAKIRIGVLDPRYGSNPTSLVVVFLGYSGETVPDDVVRVKVAELITDAKEVCGALQTTCAITDRFIGHPPTPDTP